jgi:hypothetical protein
LFLALHSLNSDYRLLAGEEKGFIPLEHGKMRIPAKNEVQSRNPQLFGLKSHNFVFKTKYSFQSVRVLPPNNMDLQRKSTNTIDQLRFCLMGQSYLHQQSQNLNYSLPVPMASTVALSEKSAMLVRTLQDLQRRNTQVSHIRAPPSQRRWRNLGEREKFLLFIKALFLYLDRFNKPRLLRSAKAVVYECTRRNRMGNLNYTPLMEAIEYRLRAVVGNEFYSQLKSYFDYYCVKKGLVESTMPTSIFAR